MDAATLVARQTPAASTTLGVFPSSTNAVDTGDSGFWGDDGSDAAFWYSRTGVIVKWSLFLGFLALIVAYVILGRMHARRRMRKGLPPLAYHRWLISRAELARFDPRYAPATYYNQNQPYGSYPAEYYGMHNMPPPPPMYDPNAARPPVYEGRAADGGDAGKTAPSAWVQERAPAAREGGASSVDGVQAPAGPPPGRL